MTHRCEDCDVVQQYQDGQRSLEHTIAALYHAGEMLSHQLASRPDASPSDLHAIEVWASTRAQAEKQLAPPAQVWSS